MFRLNPLKKEEEFSPRNTVSEADDADWVQTSKPFNSANNIVSTRCAAEYLQMTEEVSTLYNPRGSSSHSCVLHYWSVVTFEFQESRLSSSEPHSSKLKVAKLVNGYPRVVDCEKKLPLEKFLQIVEALPEFTRLEHDGLYRAIEIYLKGHPELSKNERKRICKVLDCKKLSMETSIDAAQNELLHIMELAACIAQLVVILFGKAFELFKLEGGDSGYADNKYMQNSAFCNADGDFQLVPQQGRTFLHSADRFNEDSEHTDITNDKSKNTPLLDENTTAMDEP
ncbi:hypothetical protein AgCh_027842 [Apium graveolens]